MAEPDSALAVIAPMPQSRARLARLLPLVLLEAVLDFVGYETRERAMRRKINRHIRWLNCFPRFPGNTFPGWRAYYSDVIRELIRRPNPLHCQYCKGPIPRKNRGAFESKFCQFLCQVKDFNKSYHSDIVDYFPAVAYSDDDGTIVYSRTQTLEITHYKAHYGPTFYYEPSSFRTILWVETRDVEAGQPVGRSRFIGDHGGY